MAIATTRPPSIDNPGNKWEVSSKINQRSTAQLLPPWKSPLSKHATTNYPFALRQQALTDQAILKPDNFSRNITLSEADPENSWVPFSDESSEERKQNTLGFNCVDYRPNGSPAKSRPTPYRHSLQEKS